MQVAFTCSPKQYGNSKMYELVSFGMHKCGGKERVHKNNCGINNFFFSFQEMNRVYFIYIIGNSSSPW